LTRATTALSERDIDRALRTALSRGGDWAELFWERQHIVTLTLDDGRIEDAITGIDQGAGIRVTSGDRGVYANGNLNDGDDLMAIAGRAAAGIADDQVVREQAGLRSDTLARPSTVRIDPRDVPLEQKVALLRLANERARAFDPRIHQVTVLYRESVQDVVVANSDGRHREDRRTRLVFGVLATAKAGEILESGYKALAGTQGFELLTTEAVGATAETAARLASQNVAAEPAPAGTYTVVPLERGRGHPHP